MPQFPNPRGVRSGRHRWLRTVLVPLVLALGACVTPPPPALPPPPQTAPAAPPPPVDERRPRGDAPTHATVRVYYGTDRRASGETEPARRYGSAPADATSYGHADVSIPRDHRMGELEGPSIWRLEFSPDPQRHVVLLAVTPRDREDFLAQLAEDLRSSPRPTVLVFVHGYNVTFEDAARRTAQLSYDLGFGGVPIFYSWPSQGALTGYFDDEQSVRRSEPRLKAFFADLAERVGDSDIFVLAHSMGNRPMSGALASLLTERPALRTRFKEILLMAPDIDAEVFRTEIAPRLAGQGQRVTVYASSNDLALKASRMVSGRPRLGDSNPRIVPIPGIEFVDASGVDTALLGHSYFAEVRSVIADVFEVLRDRGPAASRTWLDRIDSDLGAFFRIRVPSPASTPAGPPAAPTGR